MFSSDDMLHCYTRGEAIVQVARFDDFQRGIVAL
jgi:hypothetical protein